MRNSKSLNILLGHFIFFFLLSPSLSAQVQAKTYSVTNTGNVSNIKQYEDAFVKANMESYRYQNKRCIIKFDSGVEIEMLSARELIAQGNNVNLNDYKFGDVPNWIPPVFHLNSDGTLSAIYTKANLKQNTVIPK